MNIIRNQIHPFPTLTNIFPKTHISDPSSEKQDVVVEGNLG
jgi:hypothetical protein